MTKLFPFSIPRPVYAPEGEGQTQTQTTQQETPPTKTGGSLMSEGDGHEHRDTPPAKPWYEDIPDIAGDETLLTEAKRYKAPGEAIKSLIETKRTLRSAPKDDPMPDAGDGSDPAKVEALKQWRQRHGIPDDPTGYKIGEDITKRLLDVDKPLIDSFMQSAHAKGQPQAVVDFAVGWYVEAMEQEAQREAEADTKDKNSAEDALREEWKGNYRQNFDFAVNTAKQVLGTEYDGQSLFEARLPNGKKLGSEPAFIKAMHQVGLTLFGDGSLVGGDAVKTSQARKAEIQNIIKNEPDKYFGTPLEKEYADILAAEERASTARGFNR